MEGWYWSPGTELEGTHRSQRAWRPPHMVVVVVVVAAQVVLVAVTKTASVESGEAGPCWPRICHLPPGAMSEVGRSGRSDEMMWW